MLQTAGLVVVTASVRIIYVCVKMSIKRMIGIAFPVCIVNYCNFYFFQLHMYSVTCNDVLLASGYCYVYF